MRTEKTAPAKSGKIRFPRKIWRPTASPRSSLDTRGSGQLFGQVVSAITLFFALQGSLPTPGKRESSPSTVNSAAKFSRASGKVSRADDVAFTAHLFSPSGGYDKKGVDPPMILSLKRRLPRELLVQKKHPRGSVQAGKFLDHRYANFFIASFFLERAPLGSFGKR